MRLLLFTEYRFVSSYGEYWSDLGISNSILEDAYRGFSRIIVVARVKKELEPKPNSQKVGSDRVEIEELPNYCGIGGFLAHYQRIRRRIREIAAREGAVLLRGCSPQNIVAFYILRKKRRRFGYEAVGDPRGVFQFRSIKSPLAPVLRWFFVKAQQKICREAYVVRYVTAGFLQRHYPPSNGVKTFGFSDIQLLENDYVEAPRDYAKRSLHHSLIFVGSLEQLYKGPHILIKALKICRAQLDHLNLRMIGGGRYTGLLMQMAERYDLQTSIEFLGTISRRKDLWAYLDDADIFVLPSFTEGLPRAMVEAMARALPCIGTNVGGVGELLGENFLVPAGNPEKLAAKIIELLLNPSLLSQASKENLKKSKLYSNGSVQRERDAFIGELLGMDTRGGVNAD